MSNLVLVAAALCSTAVLAAPRAPAKFSPKVMAQFAKNPRFQKMNHLSPATKGMVSDGTHESNGRLRAPPTWRGSFSYAGTKYPYVMAGGNPRKGDETRIDTSFIALSFVFDEFVDASGNPLRIDAGDLAGDVFGSPNFNATKYTVGTGQFGDAVQRATFWSVMERDWHTTLNRPRVLTPVTIEVPVGQAQVFDAGNGKMLGFVNIDFLYSQLQTILQLEDVHTDELPILVSRNVWADQALGFHDAVETTRGGHSGIQTYLWTSWIDEDSIDPIFADATTLTHEVSEWISDPFINNPAPGSLIPESGGFCLDVVEVGDPIEFLPNQMAPITVRGRTYHTQVETMLQWFSRESPSSAFQGAYSYPDTTVLTAPAESCTP